jgi:pantoate--beta-alanine ligase
MPITATSALRVETIADLRALVGKARGEGLRIGFVPTMGALHRGHLSLVERARREADVVVMSIFVNPLQFGPTEDFSRYPRSIELDSRNAADAGVDILFAPPPGEMYREGRITSVSAGESAKRWEGEIRPGHFDGVLTVVAKLFNIVQPDVAVFGRKDLQQASLVRAMVRDLDFPVSVVVAPTIREDDGLALSSRNIYLSADDRPRALTLVRSLRAASAAFDAGERDARRLEEEGRRMFAAIPEARLEYFAVVNADSLEPVTEAARSSAVIVAARLGSTRLIDNIILGENDQN